MTEKHLNDKIQFLAQLKEYKKLQEEFLKVRNKKLEEFRNTCS